MIGQTCQIPLTQFIQKTHPSQIVIAPILHTFPVLAAKRLPIAHIETFAAGSAGKSFNGYYTWPRLGFNRRFTRADYAVFTHLDDVADVAELMETEQGRTWWRENGWSENMVFDLSEDGKSIKILNNYLEQRFGLTDWCRHRQRRFADRTRQGLYAGYGITEADIVTE